MRLHTRQYRNPGPSKKRPLDHHDPNRHAWKIGVVSSTLPVVGEAEIEKTGFGGDGIVISGSVFSWSECRRGEASKLGHQKSVLWALTSRRAQVCDRWDCTVGEGSQTSCATCMQ